MFKFNSKQWTKKTREQDKFLKIDLVPVHVL